MHGEVISRQIQRVLELRDSKTLFIDLLSHVVAVLCIIDCFLQSLKDLYMRVCHGKGMIHVIHQHRKSGLKVVYLNLYSFSCFSYPLLDGK